MHITLSPTLFLAAGVLDTIIPLIAGIAWLLFGLRNALREKKSQKPTVTQVPSKTDKRLPPVRASKMDPRNEVERFLREAQSRRKQSMSGPEQKEIEIVQPKERYQASMTEVVDHQVEPVSMEGHSEYLLDPIPRSSESASKPVKNQHLQNTISESVHQHMDRQVGTLSSRSAVSEMVHSGMDQRVGAPLSRRTTSRNFKRNRVKRSPNNLIKRPLNLRQAIILSEIIREPVALRPPK